MCVGDVMKRDCGDKGGGGGTGCVYAGSDIYIYISK